MKKFTLVLITLLVLLPTGIWAEDKFVGDINYEYTPGEPYATVRLCINSVPYVSIPAYVSIDKHLYEVNAIAPKAFNGCSELKTLVIESPTLPTMNNVEFKDVPDNLVIAFNNIMYTHQGTWNNGDSFTVTGVTTYGKNDLNFTNYEIIDAINDISVSDIAVDAFNGCIYLKTLTFESSTLPTMNYVEFEDVPENLVIAFNNIKYTHQGTWNSGDSFKVTGVTDKTLTSYEIIGAINKNYTNVTTIANDAFSGCSNITTLAIPTITIMNNVELEGVPQNLTVTYKNIKYTHQGSWIGGGSFIVTGVIDETLYSYDIITTINDKIVSIASDAFNGCNYMTTLTFIGSSLPTMNNVQFLNVQPGLVIIFRGIKYTHKGAWNNGDSFKVTGTSTDSYYSTLEILDAINNINVTEISNKAFTGLEYKEVKISKNINTISSSAFSNLTNGGIDNANRLSRITVDENNEKYFDHNGVLYSRYNQGTEEVIELVTCPTYKSSYSNIWYEGITAIGDNAFICHRNLSSITIPATVKTIGESAFNLAGADATSSLNVTFADGSELTTIGKAAFQKSSVATLVFPEGLKEIGESAFKSCLRLTTATFPTSLEKLGISAFEGCKELEHITFSESNDNKLKIIPYRAFFNCKLSSPFKIPDGVTNINGYAFNVEDFTSNLSFLPSIVQIPSSVQNIVDTAFPYGVTKQYKLNLSFGEKEEWATYYSLDNLELPTGIKAWAITGFDPNDKTKVITEELHYIHKEEAILLQRTEGAARDDFWCGAPSTENIADDAGKSSDPDIFKGSTKDIPNSEFSTIPGDKYVLNGNQFVKTNQGSLPAFRCYIVRPNANDPTDYLYFKNDGVNSDHTFIYQKDGELTQYDAEVGTATLSGPENGKITLTIIPGKDFYAKQSDITVRRNVTATSGRAPAVDQTIYSLDIIDGEDPSKPISYHFTPTSENDVYEVTVNFHKRTNLSEPSATRVVELDPDYNYTYDGTEKRPSIKSFTYNGTDVDTDFNNPKNCSFTYLNNTDAGTGIVRFEGKGEYRGTFDKTFSINKRNIRIETVNVSLTSPLTYKGEAYTKDDKDLNLKITDIVTEGGESIITEDDYTLTFTNNLNVGEANISIKANDLNYTGTTNATFTIDPRNITGKAVIDPVDKQSYTGNALEPALGIKDDLDNIVSADNYDAVYTNNVNAGTATVDITFKNNYEGTASTTFEIKDQVIERSLNTAYEGTSVWTTFFNEENLSIDSKELEVFVVTGIEGNAIQTQPVDFIPKNTAVLLKRKDNTKAEYKGYTMPTATTLPEGITPDADLFVGTATGINDNDFADIPGYKYVLVDDNFIQTTGGDLAKNRCYLNTETAVDGVISLTPGKKMNDIIILQEGQENTKAGEVTISEEVTNGNKTITVKPHELLYATVDNITVVKSASATRGRAPQFDNSEVTVKAEDAAADPSGETKYTFPFTEGYNYQITVNFQKRNDFTKESGKATITIVDNQFEYDGTEHEPTDITVKWEDQVVDPSNYEISYANNTNAGKGKVIVTGKRFFVNQKSAEFDISQRDINKVEDYEPKPIPDQTYTGSPIEPQLTIKDILTEGGESIISKDDYTVSYKNNTNVGKGTVIIESKKLNYKNNKDIFFNIVPMVMTHINIAPIPDQAWTGSAIEPTLTFTDGEGSEITLVKGTDYVVTYADNTNPGVAKAIVTFKGNYAGENGENVEKTFIITDHPQTIEVKFDNPDNQWTTYYSKDNLTKTDGLKVYVVTGHNGKEVMTEEVGFIPKETAVLLYSEGGEKSFALQTCFSEELPDGITPDKDLFQGTLDDLNISTVNGKKFVLLNGKFVQTAEGTLAANRCYLVVDDLDVPELTIGKTDGIIYQQDGKVATSSIGTASKSESDKDGWVTLTVKPNKGYYVETDDITVVRNAEAGMGRAPQIDNGAVTVTLKEGGITDDVDNNTSTYLFTYNVENDLQYQVTVNFHTAANFQESGKLPTIVFATTVYNGTEQKAEPTVTTYDGNKLTKDVDYKLVYPDEDYTKAANKKKVSVIGIRKYYNGLDRTFNIEKRNVNMVTFNAKEGQTWVEGHTPADETPQVVFTGSAIELDIIDIVNGKNILTDEEATITYAGNINAGLASVTVKSKGVNYQGEKTFNYTILPKEMTADDITAIPEQTYTGSEIKPRLTIRYGKIKLVEGDDYDVTYSDNINAGTATAKVNFKGNYAGKDVTKTFTIVDVEETLTINFDSENEWTTYYGTMNLELTDALKAYVVTGHNGNEVLTEEVTFIPKETPVLLHRISGTSTSFDVMTCSGKTLPDDIQPSDIFKGTLKTLNISTVDGTKFVLLNGQFVQTASGTLAANRCYLVVNEPIEGVTTLVIGKGISDVITLEEGQESTAGGSARVITTPDENNNLTLVVSPKSGYYADLEDLTVVYSVKAGSGRAPEVASSKAELTPVAGYDDTGKEFRYTFPYTEDYFYQVTVNFHKCVNFQTQETQPTITLEEGIFAYDGTEKKPKVVSVTIGTEELKEGRDFTVTYQNNIFAGAAQAYITGKNHYTSTFHKDFNIAQRDIKLVTVEAIPDQIYNGGRIEPEIVVKDIVLIDGVDVDLINKIENKPDYTLEFFDNIDAGKGTAKVNINANKINYAGVKTGTTFTILPKNLNLEGNKPTIDPIEPQIYTGEPIEPDVVIRDGNLDITPDNYDVRYEDNILEGTATAIITFKKNYEGTATTTFEITYKKESKQLNVDFGSQDEWITYYSPIDLANVEGLNIYVVTGLNKGQGLDLKTEQIEFIPKNIGVLLQRTDKTKTEYYGETMSSNTKLEGVTPDTELYRGTATGIDDLKAIDGIKYILLNDRFIQVVEGPLAANRCYVCISEEDEEGINHVEGDDADGIVIQENGAVSKTAGTVSVSGVSSDGYKTVTVTPASVNYATQDEVKVVRSIRNEAPSASSNRVPGIENTLVEVIAVNPAADPSGMTQYKFKYDKDYHYQVTVDFQKRINLSERATSNPVVTLKAEDIQNLEYDGKEKEPRVEKVTCNNIEVDPSNYDISYENNVNAGVPRVIITGKRFLMGSTHAEFSISKRNFSNVTVEEPIADVAYTGSPVTPTLVVKDIVNGKNIVNNDDYELILQDNTEVGTARVTLKPKNNYYGSNKDYYFNIVYAKGDANADGTVNVTDIVATVNYIMDKPSADFKFNAADVNGDGYVNVTDIVGMVNIIMKGGASSRCTASSDMVLSNTGIQLKNAEEYTAVQYDINLKDGQAVSDIILNGGSDHQLTWKMVNENTCRVVVYSMTNTAFRNHGENLFDIFMTDGQDAVLSNEILIKADGVTGINAIRMEAENGKVYDMNGHQVKNPRKGVYIMNGKKVVVK